MLVHGPLPLVENAPWGELELTVTPTLLAEVWAVPEAWSWTVIGPEGLPALSVCGAVVKASASCPQYVNVFQPSLNHAPEMSVTHQF